MTESDKNLQERAYAEVKKYEQQVKADPYRQSFHLMPPVGLLNDPNGWIQWDGVYHMFYQWNPFETGHGAKFWGHYSSTDMVNWKEEPIALAPSEWYEKNGCYSGSAVDYDGKLALIYTGNVKDEQGNRHSYQCLATSEDGVHFEKHGPVIDEMPEGYTAHIRDPKVWKENGRWYLVIGAQTADEQGQALLYASDDLKAWELKGPIAGAGIGFMKSFGYMWECPDLFSLDEKDVLIVSPQGLEPEGMFYQNVYQAGYFIGETNLEQPIFHHGEFRELDRGFEFYAPQTTVDEKGRRILVGWMGVPEQNEEDHPTIANRWVHCLTIPRELRHEEGKLIQKPIEELQQLRQSQGLDETITVYNEETILEEKQAAPLELSFNGLESISDKCQWTFRGGTRLVYDKEEQLITLERTHVKTWETEKRQCRVDLLDELHIYLDHSSIEIFVNDGEEVFTARIFPDPSNQSVTIRSSEPTTMHVKTWHLA
ncbi:glycoside hydrolase family 32 protein [Salipaludibacillus daqingensis]|uniref:glycoside hydrolase family 32 protein n=1 Tax=Salipaludibacillus daqingensis TaxID=3041001 RepID=UPI00247616D5|nr:sucrose-6-phosphate hydrolase [Salipaludibacillus daqingensis]